MEPENADDDQMGDVKAYFDYAANEMESNIDADDQMT